MVGVMVPVGTGDGGTTGLTSAFSPATPDDVTPTTPSALWEAITPGSDYKALMNTHTHTHTPWSLTHITLDTKEEEKKSIFQQEYF